MTQEEFKRMFARNLRRVMIERGKTQADICTGIGVSQPTVSTWMTAKKVPRMETLDALCEYLSCQRSDLIEDCKVAGDRERWELARLAMTADLEHVETALILLKALVNKNTAH